MIRRITLSVVLQVSALVTHVIASEATITLADKVETSDLVAVVEITAVEQVDWSKYRLADEYFSAEEDFKMHAIVVDRIKGSSPATISISTLISSISSTAGFSAYGIEPGKSYVAYLREDGENHYRLGWDSNQYFEAISSDGVSVRDIGQTTRQVALAPKLRELKAIAQEEWIYDVVRHPIFLTAILTTVATISFIVVRKKISKKHEHSRPETQKAEQGGDSDAEEAV